MTSSDSNSRSSRRSALERTEEAMEANPLAVLAGGAVIGLLAGAMLPRTQREADLFGKAGKRMTAAAAAARDTGLKELEARGISGKAAKAQVGRLLDGVVEAAGTAGEAAASAARTKAKTVK
jgi:hypothetical protein